MARFHVFKNWFLSEILNVDNWRAIMILPIETLSPRYRDVPPDKKSKPPHSINELWLSPITGCPELVVPGESPTSASQLPTISISRNHNKY